MSFDFTYHLSPEHLHVGCEKPRAYFVPFHSEISARRGMRQESRRFLSLCGDWDFCYYPSLAHCPDFLAEGFCVQGFDKLTATESLLCDYRLLSRRLQGSTGEEPRGFPEWKENKVKKD